MARVRTLIADDTGLLRRLLAEQLSREADIEIVGQAADGRQAIDLARTTRPDVVLLDLDMPVMNGIQAAQRIAASQPHVGIVLLTGHEQLATLGKMTGASECLDKRCTPEELAEAIRRAAAHVRRAPNARPAGGRLDVGAILDRMAAQYALTDRERTVVDRMVTTEMTAAQMARALSDEDGLIVTESSVKHALDRALNKMGIEPRTRAALIRRVLDAPAGAGDGYDAAVLSEAPHSPHLSAPATRGRWEFPNEWLPGTDTRCATPSRHSACSSRPS